MLFNSIALLAADPQLPAGEGIMRAWDHDFPLPPAVAVTVTAAACVIAVVWVLYVYWNERTVRPGGRLLLASLRIAAIFTILWMIYGWFYRVDVTDLPDLLIVIDNSESMGHADGFTDSELVGLIAAATKDHPQQLGANRRFDLARGLLLQDDAELLNELRKQYNLKVFLLSENNRADAGQNSPQLDADPEKLLALQPTGKVSRLGDGLKQILEKQRGRPTAAAIVLTDGVTTEGKSIGDVADVARRKQIPLYVVGIGQKDPAKDLAITDLLAADSAFVGDIVPIEVRVDAAGIGGKVTVSLTQVGSAGEQLIAEEDVELPADGGSKPVRLSIRPQTAGEYQLVVEIPNSPEEVITENNRRTHTLVVQDETIRVLFVQNQPSYEFRYLKDLLSRGLARGTQGNEEDAARKTIDLDTVLQESDPQHVSQDETAIRNFPVSRSDLFAYDVLIFGDVNPEYFSRAQLDLISQFVRTPKIDEQTGSRSGRGLIVMSGPRFTPLAFEETPLAELLPVGLEDATLPAGNSLDEPYRAQPTPLGLASSTMQVAATTAESEAIWASMPPLYWLLETPTVKRGAQVLSVHPEKRTRSGQPLPLVVMQFVGAGKVVMHNTDETYRWSRHEQGSQYYARYWLQMLRYLTRSKISGDSGVQLTTDRQSYRFGETIRLRLSFGNEADAPADADAATVIIQHDSGSRQQVVLSRNALNRGVFEATATAAAEGNYRAWLVTPAVEGELPTANFVVTAPPGELAKLELDEDDLKKAARGSRGKYYAWKDASEIAEELPPGRQVRVASRPPEPIWNHFLLPVIFCTLVVSEWILRKLFGLM